MLLLHPLSVWEQALCAASESMPPPQAFVWRALHSIEVLLPTLIIQEMRSAMVAVFMWLRIQKP